MTVALPSEDASLAMRHLHPENFTRSVGAVGCLCFSRAGSAPQVSSPVLTLQLFEWEFSLMKVKELFLGAPLILPLARGQSQGRGHPWASCSVPWPPLSFGEISLCKGGFGGMLIFHISMVTCSQTFQRATSDCAEWKVSFCVKFYSLGERKTRKLQNKDRRKLEQIALVFFFVALKLANTI